MKKIGIYLTLGLLLAFVGCNKSDDSDTPEVFDEACVPLAFDGLDISIDGDATSTLDPESEAYTNYLNCVMACAETDPDDPECMMDCLNSSGILPQGGAFTLMIYVTNISLIDITFTIEPGTWFIPSSGDYQPMMTAVTITKTISPGEPIEIPIPVFCLAADKSAPDEVSDYSLCNQVNLSCLEDILNILKTKDFSAISFTELMQVQQIIWDCSEGNEVNFDFLNGLP